MLHHSENWGNLTTALPQQFPERPFRIDSAGQTPIQKLRYVAPTLADFGFMH